MVMAVSASLALAVSPSIYLTVGYCPSVFSGEGAVVEVNAHTGDINIVKKFSLPPDSLGCPMDEDPNYLTDLKEHTTYLSFGSDWGSLSTIDLTNKRSKMISVKGKSKDGTIFDGFTNMALAGSKKLKGLTPHVTESGYCDDGCFRFGEQEITGLQAGLFTGYAAAGVPFKAVMSSTSYYNELDEIYYAQGSYPLATAAKCMNDETEQCLFAIDAKTGNLVSSKNFNNATIHSFREVPPVNGSVTAWFSDFKTCKVPYESYAFAEINLVDAQIVSNIRCIPKGVVLHTKPSLAAFIPVGSLFATGSGTPPPPPPSIGRILVKQSYH
jgi:hypothetical protein